jgi:hypothetical protein
MKLPITHYPRRKREWTGIVIFTISGLISFGVIAIIYHCQF